MALQKCCSTRYWFPQWHPKTVLHGMTQKFQVCIEMAYKANMCRKCNSYEMIEQFYSKENINIKSRKSNTDTCFLSTFWNLEPHKNLETYVENAARKEQLYKSLCDVIQWSVCLWQDPPVLNWPPPTPCQLNRAGFKRLHQHSLAGQLELHFFSWSGSQNWIGLWQPLFYIVIAE